MTTHGFEPTGYHLTIGPHQPVLSIEPGDTVHTSTVCAGGRDRDGKVVVEGGNPQTGPFFINGAERGDVLAVRFDRIVPNRRSGWSSTMLAANVVEPHFVRTLPGEWVRADWDVDVEAGTATLVGPETSLGRLCVPLDPMLGCFGVAPPGGQALGTGTSFVNGGNMDYRGFREGVTVYFPVFETGALLHLGDGHAVQGDGEITGTGIEISMDVTFTAWIHRKNQPITWPRAEDGTFIMAVGNARPLDEAVQHATTELCRWLMEDYDLDQRGASILMGQCIRYDLGTCSTPPTRWWRRWRSGCSSRIGSGTLRCDCDATAAAAALRWPLRWRLSAHAGRWLRA
jgi:acetamidase/formamidase